MHDPGGERGNVACKYKNDGVPVGNFEKNP